MATRRVKRDWERKTPRVGRCHVRSFLVCIWPVLDERVVVSLFAHVSENDTRRGQWESSREISHLE
jgi:hypothetical protein